MGGNCQVILDQTFLHLTLAGLAYPKYCSNLVTNQDLPHLAGHSAGHALPLLTSKVVVMSPLT